ARVRRGPLQQRERFALAMLDLVHGALAWHFVGTPAQDFRSMPKTPAGEMIICDFDHDLRSDRFPLASPLRTPTTRAARRVTCESRWFSQRLEFFCQSAAVACFKGGRETDMVKQSIIAVQSE